MTNQDWFEIAKFGVSILTLASIVIAFLSYRANIKKLNEDRIRERDRELNVQAEKSLRWAYDVLTNEGQRIPPLPDRLSWLTCARHLLRGRSIAAKITGETYKVVYAEVEEYWRHKFYVALEHDSLRNRSYFSNGKRSEWPENIEITSALVIVDFSNWNKTAIDPTDLVDRQDLIKNGNGFKGMPGMGLRSYVDAIEEFKAQLPHRP